MPSPRRWPMVKPSMPACVPSVFPSSSTTCPEVSRSGPTSADETEVIVVGDEADLLAFRLVVHRQPLLAGQPADLRLGIIADREEHVGEQFGTQPEEHVGLVLARVVAACDPERAVVRAGDPGVMAGGDEIGPNLLAIRPELAELEPDVAHHAGIRRPAGHVLVGEVVLDPPEVALEVERRRTGYRAGRRRAGRRSRRRRCNRSWPSGRRPRRDAPVRMKRPTTS